MLMNTQCCLHHSNFAYADEYICRNMLICVTNVRFRNVDCSREIDVCLHDANVDRKCCRKTRVEVSKDSTTYAGFGIFAE